jgi:hypothetical protein
MLGLCVGDREARADCQCGELIDRIAAGAPVRKLLLVEALGHTRAPFAGYRPGSANPPCELPSSNRRGCVARISASGRTAKFDLLAVDMAPRKRLRQSAAFAQLSH